MKLPLMLTATILIAAWCAHAGAKQYPYQRCFDLASQQHGVALDLLIAVAAVESGWDPDARSAANAHGIMQIRWPQTAKHLGSKRVAELYNPCLNISLGASYLSELGARYHGDIELMLAAYNYGPTRIQTSDDVPPGVKGYVERVLTRRIAIAGELATETNDLVRSGGAPWREIIRFQQHARAKRYIASLVQRIPDAEFQIKTEAGFHVVYLDTTGLNPGSLFRLGKLIPVRLSQTHPPAGSTK